jgi:hypothetical protein
MQSERPRILAFPHRIVPAGSGAVALILEGLGAIPGIFGCLWIVTWAIESTSAAS